MTTKWEVALVDGKSGQTIRHLRSFDTERQALSLLEKNLSETLYSLRYVKGNGIVIRSYTVDADGTEK